MTDPSPKPTTQLSVGYSKTEDRLVLWLGKGESPVEVHLTRRLTGLLVNGLAGIISRSSATAAKAPVDLRDDVVSMERQSAVAASSLAKTVPAALPTSGTPHLIEAVDIATQPTTFRLQFRTPASVTVGELQVTRAEMHQVIDLLRRQAELAQWALPVDAAWLNAREGKLVVN